MLNISYITLRGKFLDYRKYACVKDLTNVMSAAVWGQGGKHSFPTPFQHLGKLFTVYSLLT